MCLFHDLFCTLSSNLILSIDNTTLEAWLIPLILLLVCSKIFGQSLYILTSLVPNLTERYIKQQDTIMILFYQVTEIHILLLQMCICICHHLIIAHCCWQCILRTSFVDKTLMSYLHSLIALHLS